MNEGYCPPGQSLPNAFKQAGVPFTPLLDAVSNCGAVRVNLAGNYISSLVTPTNTTPVERIFRRNPVDGTLTATPNRPFIFEIGEIAVPQQMVFVMLDVRRSIYVPDGVVAGGTVELEGRRLSTSVGYDFKFTDTRNSDLSYEMEPSNPTPALLASPTLTQAEVNRLRAQATGAAASGNSTLPQRHRREAQLEMPFTYIVNENKKITFQVVIVRPIPIPVSFFETEVSGFLMAKNAMEEFAKSIRPCV